MAAVAGADARSWNCAALSAAPSQPRVVYAATDGGVLRSEDGGATWSATTWWAGYSFRAVAVDPQDPQTVYAGKWPGLRKSTDGGSTWTDIDYSGEPNENACVSALAVDPTNPQRIYLGRGDGNSAGYGPKGGVYRSIDGGSTWTPINTGLAADTYVSAITIDPADPAVLYLAAGTQAQMGGSRGVYKSLDGGDSWRATGEGLGSNPAVRAVVVDPTNSQVLYAGVEWAGVFRSPDGGSTWQAVNTGLDNLGIKALALDPGDHTTLHAATNAGGVRSITFVTRLSPAIELSAWSLSFGSVQVGASKTLTLSIANPGTAPLVVTAITVAGSDRGQFTVTPSSFSVEAGSPAQLVSVTFTPTAAGGRTATLAVEHNVAGTPAGEVFLEGSGLGQSLPTVAVSIPDVSGYPGQTGLAAAVQVDRAAGIASGELTLTYDPAVLTFASATVSDLAASAGITATSRSTSGQVQVTLSGLQGMAVGSGALVSVSFNVKAGSVYGTYQLGLTAVLRDQHGASMPVTTRNGSLRVSSAALVSKLTLSTVALTFDTTAVGARSQRSLSIANADSVAHAITGVTIIGADSSQFAVTPVVATIPAGQAQAFAVVFAPTSVGLKRASLAITQDGATTATTVTLTASSRLPPRPTMQLSASGLAFGAVRVLERSELQLEIRNVGELPLHLDSLRVDSPLYGVTPTAVVVPAGERDTVRVTFSPTSVDEAPAQLVLYSDDPDGAWQAVSLTGRGRLPHVTASADTLSFGRVVVGQSSSQVLTLTNNSSSTVTVSNVVPGDPQYSASTRSFTFTPGSSRDITVTLTPLEGRSATSTLTILTSDTEVSALTVVLAAKTGTVLGAAAITVLPTSLTFGSVALGQSKSVTLLVTNDGGSSLRVLNVVASSNDVTVSKAGFILAAGAEELLTVTLQPTRAGSVAETLELQSNDPLHPLVQVPLRATAVAGGGRPSLVLDASALSFGQVAMGETSEFQLPVQNAGTATLTISNVVSDNVQVVGSPTTMSVPPQETRSLTVRYRPMPGGALSGRLTLYSNDTAQPQVGVSWSALEVRSPYLSLTRVTPTDGAFGVAASAEIQLVFSEPLYYRRGYTALDIAVVPEPVSGPVDKDLQVRGDGRTVVIPVTLAAGTVYHLVVYGATGRSGLELFDMVESTFSTGAGPAVLAKVAGRVAVAFGDQVTGSIYLYDASRKLAGQASVALDGSFEIPGVQAGTYNLYLDGAVADGHVATGTYDVNGDGVADALTVRAGIDQTGLSITATVRTGAPPLAASDLVAVDLDSSAGNQGLATLGGVEGGRSMVLEVYATAADGWTGAGVSVAFDSSQVSFAGAEAGDNLLQKNGGTA
ncbi:MAG: choice-of-anchor D domain-containing protein, partial [Candidatus Latescibacterota bacterium]